MPHDLTQFALLRPQTDINTALTASHLKLLRMWAHLRQRPGESMMMGAFPSVVEGTYGHKDDPWNYEGAITVDQVTLVIRFQKDGTICFYAQGENSQVTVNNVAGQLLSTALHLETLPIPKSEDDGLFEHEPT